MTEKRFVYDDFDDVIKDTYTQKEYDYHIGELELIVDEINNLHEESKALKKEIGDLGELHAKEITKIEDAFDEEILQLEEENKQLKSEINMLKTTIGRNEGYIDRLTHKGEWR